MQNMSPIEYQPEALEAIAKSVLASKRLKNRTGKAICSGGDFTAEGGILDVISAAQKHDSATAHSIVVREEACRMGLIILSDNTERGDTKNG